MYIELLDIKILKIKLIKRGNARHKAYIRHTPLTVNYVHTLNIKQI